MVTRSQIIAVGSLTLVRLLADIAELLRRLGHNVAFYENLPRSIIVSPALTM